MKNKILTLFLLSLNVSCMMAPTGEVIGPNIEAEVSLAAPPRIHRGTRSSVTVWLHPQYVVRDAYGVAQAHCSRWGLWANPSNNWGVSSVNERYLNYHCIQRRPRLTYKRYRRPFPRRRWIKDDRPVYTPRPVRRRTFGGSIQTHDKEVLTEVGKPWEHMRPKKSRSIYKRPVRREVGKPWEHRRKRKVKTIISKPVFKRRRTFGKSALAL